MNLDDILRGELARLEAADLRRAVKAPPEGTIDFASNDYLGLARHPALIEAANEATRKHGNRCAGLAADHGHEPRGARP